MRVYRRARALSAVLVSDKWFNAEKPTVPPSFVTLDLDAKQAVVPTASGDVRAPIGHYIMQDEGTMEVLGAISPADYRRDYRELGFREQTPDEEVRQARAALAGHPVNVHLSTTSDLETLLRRVLHDWKDQRERIAGLENRNREMAIDNARLRISAATPDPVIRAGQIQQIATAIIQRDGQTAGVGALNIAIAIVDGSYRRSPAELIKAIGERDTDVDRAARTLGLPEGTVAAWLNDMVAVLQREKAQIEKKDDDDEIAS